MQSIPVKANAIRMSPIYASPSLKTPHRVAVESDRNESLIQFEDRTEAGLSQRNELLRKTDDMRLKSEIVEMVNAIIGLGFIKGYDAKELVRVFTYLRAACCSSFQSVRSGVQISTSLSAQKRKAFWGDSCMPAFGIPLMQDPFL